MRVTWEKTRPAEDPDEGGQEARRQRSTMRRVYSKRAMEHPARREIVDLIGATPGMNKSEVAREMDIHHSLAGHHIDCLEEIGLVVTRKSKRRREVHCFVTEDQALWNDKHTRILYGHSPTRRVALYLTDNPGATTSDIAEALGFSTVSARQHLRALRDRGLAEHRHLHREVIYCATEPLERWVEEVGCAFRDEMVWPEGVDGDPS